MGGFVMTKEEIIEMARQAGARTSSNPDEYDVLKITDGGLEAFAKLVAKHTLLNTDPSSFMSYQEGVEVGRMAEREACAKVADGWPDYDVQGLAEAIRARGQANG